MRFCALRGTAQGAGFAAPQQQLSRPCCPTRPQNACKGVHAVDRLSLHRAASLGLRAHPCAPLTARGQGLARAVADGAVPSLPPEQEQEAATVGASPGSHDRHSMGSDNEDEQLARARQQLEQMQVDVAQSGSAWRAAGDVDRFIQAFELLTNQVGMYSACRVIQSQPKRVVREAAYCLTHTFKVGSGTRASLPLSQPYELQTRLPTKT